MSRTGADQFARLIAVFIAVLFFVWSLPSRATADAGDLNPLFGNQGKVIIDFFGNWDEAKGVAIQRDGKIVAAGYTQTITTNDDFAVARFTVNGELDQTFGSAGRVTTDFFGGLDQAYAVAIQPDGKIIVAGEARVNSGYIDFALARFNNDGSLDQTFGTNGKITAGYPAAFTHARDIALQADGKIVVAGILYANPGQAYRFGLARFLQDGTLDSTFGIDGWVTTNFYTGGQKRNTNDQLSAIAIQEDGAIVAVGRTNTSGSYGTFAVARYRPNGALDENFGSRGKVAISFFDNGDVARDVDIQPDGKIVVVGLVFNSIVQKVEFGIARLNSDGSLDTRFGSGGKVTEGFKAFSAAATSVIVQPDSRIVVAGLAEFKKRNDGYADDAFALARFNSDGSLDQTFGSNGKTTQDFGELGDEASSVAIAPDGRLIAAGGSANFQTGTDFAVVCYESDLRFPEISIAKVSGKQLFVDGHNFDAGAEIFLNGQGQKTANDGANPDSKLIGKKAGKKTKSGDKIWVRNSNGVESGEYIFP